MRKLLTLTAALLMGASLMNAQESTGRWNMSVQGGVLASLNENCFSYNDNGHLWNLVTPQASLSVGYDFNETYGIRANVGYGKNMAACNVKQTNIRNQNGFWPYGFKSLNAFVDVILNFNGLNGITSKFAPKIYGGLGYGHAFGFWRPEYSMMNDADLVALPMYQTWDKYHPWQDVTESTHVAGFRFGFIAEYDFTDNFGVYADISGEAYNDFYNGLEPFESDHAQRKGYAGFPVDLRGLISVGVMYRFK